MGAFVNSWLELEGASGLPNKNKLVDVEDDENLLDYKNNARNQISTLEEYLIDACENALEVLLEYTERLNEEKRLGVVTRKIRTNNRKILRDICGIFERDFVLQRSADNPRLLKFLSANNLKQKIGCEIRNGNKYAEEQIKLRTKDIEFFLKVKILSTLVSFKQYVKDIEANEREQIRVVFDLWKAQHIYELSKR